MEDRNKNEDDWGNNKWYKWGEEIKGTIEFEEKNGKLRPYWSVWFMGKESSLSRKNKDKLDEKKKAK